MKESISWFDLQDARTKLIKIAHKLSPRVTDILVIRNIMTHHKLNHLNLREEVIKKLDLRGYIITRKIIEGELRNVLILLSHYGLPMHHEKRYIIKLIVRGFDVDTIFSMLSDKMNGNTNIGYKYPKAN